MSANYMLFLLIKFFYSDGYDYLKVGKCGCALILQTRKLSKEFQSKGRVVNSHTSICTQDRILYKWLVNYDTGRFRALMQSSPTWTPTPHPRRTDSLPLGSLQAYLRYVWVSSIFSGIKIGLGQWYFSLQDFYLAGIRNRKQKTLCVPDIHVWW